MTNCDKVDIIVNQEGQGRRNEEGVEEEIGEV